MGRIGRQRKFKSIDPFSKKNPADTTNEKGYNLAPKGKDLDENDKTIPRKARRVMQLSKIVAKGSQGISKKKTKPKKSAKQGELNIKPGESRTQFFARLDRQVGDALNKALTETKKLREKRKEHLKKRDKKSKSRRSQSELTYEEKESPQQEKVKFGDVVSQPPTLSAVPRKAKSEKGPLDLKLMDVIKGDAKDTSMDKLYKVKRKEMTEKMKNIHDKEREKAIAEYRKMKQRKLTKA